MPRWVAVTLASLYGGLFTIGVVGNISVVVSVWQRGPSQQQPHRQSLMFSLAIADLTVCLICIPSSATAVLTPEWWMPAFLCPILAVGQHAAHAASTLSLTLLAVDRYLTVRKPKLALKVVTCTKTLILIMWLIAICLAIPLSFVTYVSPYPDRVIETMFCYEDWPFKSIRVIYHTTNLLLVHIMPCLIVAICHFSVSSSLRQRAVDEIKMQQKPRQVIIMARDKSIINGGNTQKIMAAGTSDDSEEDTPPYPLNIPIHDFKDGTKSSKQQRRSKHPGKSKPVLKPSRNMNTIIRAHRRMRLKKTSEESSLFTAYRAHSTITRRRLGNMLIVLVGMFAMCWLPYVVAVLAWAWIPCLTTRQAVIICLTLGHAHSAISPVIYWIMNRSFLSTVRNIFTCQLKLPFDTEIFSFLPCSQSSCLSRKRPNPTPWAGNSSTNEDNLGAFNPKYLNPNIMRPAASCCTSHYFH